MPEFQEREPGRFYPGDTVMLIAGSGSFSNVRVGDIGVVSAAQPTERCTYVDWTTGRNAGHTYGPYTRNLELVTAADAGADSSDSPKPFQLVALRDGKIETLPGEAFDTGKAAGDRAKVLSAAMGCKVQPRRVETDADWRAREERRFEDGTYTRLPASWDLPPITDHFLHLSEKRGFVAYTEDAEKGAQDRQKRVRAGAYARAFYPHLSGPEVTRYAALVSCDGMLRIGTEREDFRRAYQEGPSSCMSSPDDIDDLPCHPSEIYAGGDLAIAWIEDDEEIVARCVVWPERKFHTRAYGDIDKIKALLQAEGYVQRNFHGAKLLRIPYEHGLVCPYIDESSSYQGNPSALCVTDEGTHLLINEEGDGYEASSTGGWIETVVLATCGHCEERFEEDSLVPVRASYGTYSYCRDCVEDNTFRCDGFGQRMTDSHDSYETRDGRTISAAFIDRYDTWFVSDGDGYAYPIGERVTLDDGDVWSKAEFAEHGFTCAGSGGRFSRSEPHETVGGLTYHADHLPELEEEEEEDLCEAESADDELDLTGSSGEAAHARRAA